LSRTAQLASCRLSSIHGIRSIHGDGTAEGTATKQRCRL
jgi:hypothetical protein